MVLKRTKSLIKDLYGSTALQHIITNVTRKIYHIIINVVIIIINVVIMMDFLENFLIVWKVSRLCGLSLIISSYYWNRGNAGYCFKKTFSSVNQLNEFALKRVEHAPESLLYCFCENPSRVMNGPK